MIIKEKYYRNKKIIMPKINANIKIKNNYDI